MANWFLRISGANPNLPGSYLTPPTSNPSGCPGTGKICTVDAEVDENGAPIIDDVLLSEMSLALQSGTDRPRVLLRAND